MSMRCPKCGLLYADDARFCTRDGGRLVVFTAGGLPPERPDRLLHAELPGAGAPTSGADGTPARAITHANLSGHILDARYEIARKLGEGGMSHVYLGQDVATKERVAIKILAPSLARDPNAMARLRREAALGSQLAHPNVCHIVRMGETPDGLVYVVMPFVEGELLSDRTNRSGTLPLPLTVHFVSEIAAGLDVAHQLKIIHRDLKPENVMIGKRPDGSEFAVVMDFGLAKERKAGPELEQLTATGIILGTPEFMSPEQLRGKPLDARSDVYALALMTYEMLTGKLPFDGPTQQDIMIARLRQEPIPLSKRSPGKSFPPGVDRAIAKAMQRDAEQRHATAPEFADDLRAAATGNGDAPATRSMVERMFRR